MIGLGLLLYLLSTVIFVLFNIKYVYYIAYIYVFVNSIIRYKKTKDDIHLVESLVYSIIIPDNYIVYLPIFTIFLIKIFRKEEPLFNNRLDAKKVALVIIPIFYLFINFMLNEKAWPNVLFSIVYYIPLVLCTMSFGRIKLYDDSNERLLSLLKASLLLQLFANILIAIVNYGLVKTSIDFDWASGTFGLYQGNILLFYLFFCFVVFYKDFITRKKNLMYVVLAAFLSIMTGSIALIIMFVFSFIFYQVFNKEIKISKKIIVILSALLYAVVFAIITPNWINNYITKIITTDNKSAYISKIRDYENVYINIPKNDKKFLLIGNGIGNYSSRAALTCTGLYIESYNNRYEPSMSTYTNNYIYAKLSNIYKHRLGSMDTPYSTYITIMGELGVIGVVIFAVLLIVLYKKSPGYFRIFILFFILSCLIENYLEFAKVVSLVFLGGSMKAMFYKKHAKGNIKKMAEKENE